MEICCFGEIDMFPSPTKDKNSPASSSCYQHRAWASLTLPSCQTKNPLYRRTISDFRSCQVSQMGFALCPPGPRGKVYCRYTRKWTSHHKGTKQRRPHFLSEAAGKPVDPRSGDIQLVLGRRSWHKPTRCYNWQAAVMTLGRKTRWWTAAGSAVPPLPLSSRPGALCCRLMGLAFSLATGKKKKVSAPGCFSSISCYLPFRTCSLVQGIVDYVKSREGITRQTQRSALSLFQCPLRFAGSVSLSSRKYNCNSGRVSIIFLFAGNKKKPQADMFLKRNPKGYILHTTETRKKKKNREECLTSSKAFTGQTKGEQNMSSCVIYLLASYCHPCLKTLVSYMLGHLTVMLMSWPVISSGAGEGKKIRNRVCKCTCNLLQEHMDFGELCAVDDYREVTVYHL